MTRTEAAQCVAYLMAHYPGTQLSKENVEAYRSKLEKHDFESTKAAIDQLSEKLKWFPKIAEIIELAQAEWSVRRPKPKLLPGPVEQPKVAPAYLEIQTSHAYLLPPPGPAKPEPVKYRHKLLTPEEQLAKLRDQEAQWATESPAEPASEAGEGTNDG